jgi:hypothetical protein
MLYLYFGKNIHRVLIDLRLPILKSLSPFRPTPTISEDRAAPGRKNCPGKNPPEKYFQKPIHAFQTGY